MAHEKFRILEAARDELQLGKESNVLPQTPNSNHTQNKS